MKIALSLALATLFFVGCGDNSQKETHHEAKQAVAQHSEAATSMDSMKKEALKQVQEAQKTVTNHVEEAKKAVAKHVEAAQKTVQKAVATQKTGAQIFVTCASCHGQHAEKKALGKSQIIKGWDAAKIEHALHGYKDGSYGGAMKGVMKGQVSKLSDEDIKAVAEHISKM